MEQRARALYESPPDLLARFPRVDSIPLEERIRKGTKYVRAWIRGVDQQRRITAIERERDKERFGDIA